VDGWMVSPRKSRKKSSCFSNTKTSTPARASRKPSIAPAGPQPTMQQRTRVTLGAIAVDVGPPPANDNQLACRAGPGLGAACGALVHGLHVVRWRIADRVGVFAAANARRVVEVDAGMRRDERIAAGFGRPRVEASGERARAVLHPLVEVAHEVV